MKNKLLLIVAIIGLTFTVNAHNVSRLTNNKTTNYIKWNNSTALVNEILSFYTPNYQEQYDDSTVIKKTEAKYKPTLDNFIDISKGNENNNRSAKACPGDCSDALIISSLPYTDAGQTTCGACNVLSDADACNSNYMNGPEIIYSYTPTSDGWIEVISQTDNYYSGVFLLDNCPSDPNANCLASNKRSNPANQGYPTIIYNLIAGQTYYIVVSSYQTCINFDLHVTNINQPTPTEEDCYGAQFICNSTLTENAPGNGQGNYPSEINGDISSIQTGELNGKWYSFTAMASGTMLVDILPVDNLDDYDFALFDVTNGGCPGIYTGSSPEIAGNYAAVDQGGDTGVDPSSTEQDYDNNAITVSAGNTYMLYITQYSVSTNGYTINLGGANYIDNQGPELKTILQPNCGQNEIIVQFSEAVSCPSISSDGSDFTLTNPTGSNLTITGSSSSICDAGGAFTGQVTLVLDGNIEAPGTYSIGVNAGTIADQCGYVTTGNVIQFTIVPPNIVMGTNSPICVGAQLNLTETGGDVDNWVWTGPNSFNSTNQNPSILNAQLNASGKYYVEGTNTITGCSAKDSIDVTIIPPPTVSYTVDANDTICFGESVTLTGAGTATNYIWNNSVNNGIAFIPTSTNTYTLIGEDANGCKDSTQVQIVVNPLPNIFAGNDQSIPYNATTTINDATPTGLNYSWIPADSLVDATVLNPTTLPLHVSNPFILEGTDPLTACSNKDTMLISIIGGPLSVQIFALANDSICEGQAHSINALASGGASTNYTYNWTSSPAANYPNAAVLNLDTVSVTTTYYLEVVEGGINFAYDTITITIMPTPVITSIEVDSLNCYGDNSGQILINAIGVAPLSYSIDGGISFVNDSLFANMPESIGLITAVKTDFGCISYGDTVDVFQPAILDVVVDTLINASCGNNNGIITVDVSGGTPNYMFSWADIGTTLDSISAGNYTLTVTDYNTCQATLDYTIINQGGGHLVLESISDVVCYGDSTGSLTVKMTEGNTPFDFYISLYGNNIDSALAFNDSIFTVNFLPENTYQVTAYEGAGCVSTIDVTISSNSEIIINPTVTDLNCWEDGTGKINVDVTGGVPRTNTPYYDFLWSGPDSYVSTLEDIILLNAGSYSLIVTDSLSCQKTIENIIVNQPLEPGVTINVQNETQCFGDSTAIITSVGQGGTVPYNYNWTDGTSVYHTNELQNISAGEYHLIITDANNCLISDTTININELDPIQIVDTIIYTGTDASIQIIEPGCNGYSYEWSNYADACIIDNLTSGEYIVTITNNFTGCTVKESYNIDIPLVIPTVITPNGDGANDTWQIPGIEAYDQVSVQIYNRWGDVIYSFSDTGYAYSDKSNQWNGKYQDKDLPLGTYVYILVLNKEKEYSGTVTIVR